MQDYILTLNNDVKIGILELGNPSSNNVVFYNHGFPGCRHDSTIFQNCIAGKDIRLITLDRPGYGNSTFIENRTILDYVTAFKEVLEKLQIQHCKLIGISGGTPYALACAAKLPELVTKVAIISGISEIQSNDVFEGMTLSNKLFLKLGRFSPTLVKPFSTIIGFLWSKNVDNMVKWMKLFMSNSDKEILSDAENERLVKRALQESLKQGSRTIVKDFSLLCQPWGFSLSEIQAPIHFWHGDDDCYVPLAMAKQNASFIKQAELTTIPKAGHLVVAHINDQIIDYLVD